MSFRPEFQTQLDDSKCRLAQCMPTTVAMAVGRDWLGTVRGNSVAMRDHIGVYCPGTTVGQNVSAAKALYSTKLEYRWDVPFDAVEDALRGGRGVAALIRYSELHGTPYDASPGFDSWHGVYLNSIWRDGDRDRVVVGDPLANGWGPGIPKGWQSWPLSLVRRAMTEALSNGHVEFAFTRSTTSNERKALFTGKWRHKPDGKDQDEVSRGSLVRKVEHRRGPQWFVGGRLGHRWYGIDRINGMSATAAVGDPLIWLPKGLFVGAGGVIG